MNAPRRIEEGGGDFLDVPLRMGPGAKAREVSQLAKVHDQADAAEVRVGDDIGGDARRDCGDRRVGGRRNIVGCVDARREPGGLDHGRNPETDIDARLAGE